MKNTYRPLPKSLTIKPSEVDGIGVFAVEDIPKDTNLGHTHTIIKDLPVRIADRIERVNFGGFYNHSDKPNVERKLMSTDEQYKDCLIERYYLFTTRDIKDGEELTATYKLKEYNI